MSCTYLFLKNPENSGHHRCYASTCPLLTKYWRSDGLRILNVNKYSGMQVQVLRLWCQRTTSRVCCQFWSKRSTHSNIASYTTRSHDLPISSTRPASCNWLAARWARRAAPWVQAQSTRVSRRAFGPRRQQRTPLDHEMSGRLCRSQSTPGKKGVLADIRDSEPMESKNIESGETMYLLYRV